MNRISIDKRCSVMSALVEGVSINATCRMTGVAKHTVLKLLKDMGCACAAYHDAHVRNLRVRRIQCDEIWAFVYAKQKNVTLEQMEQRAGDVWTWTAIDADTKLIVSYIHAGGSRGRYSTQFHAGLGWESCQPLSTDNGRSPRLRRCCRRCLRRGSIMPC